MHVRRLLMAAATVTAIAAVPSAAQAQSAGKTDKATGGGQVLLSSDDAKRSTIAFTAQSTTTNPDDNAGKGQVQFIDRSNGGGKNAVKFHGVVDCIVVEGNRALIGGHDRDDEDVTFELNVLDGGEPNQERDMLYFDQSADGDCATEDRDDDEPDVALAKGNAQVRDGKGGNALPQDEEQAPAGLSTSLLTSALGL